MTHRDKLNPNAWKAALDHWVAALSVGPAPATEVEFDLRRDELREGTAAEKAA